MSKVKEEDIMNQATAKGLSFYGIYMLGGYDQLQSHGDADSNSIVSEIILTKFK